MNLKHYSILILILFSSCRTSKRDVSKSVEKKKIEIENAIEDKKEVKVDTYTFLETSNFTIEPIDPIEETHYISGKDTFKFKNAKVTFGKSKETKEDKSIITENHKDNSKISVEEVKKDKDIKRETKSASWGLNLALILGLLLLLLLIYRCLTKTKSIV